MIGQEKLISIIDKFNIDTLPHSLMLVGDWGSGRHTLFNYIVDKFSFPWFDITDKLNKDILDEIYTKTEPIFYLIDIDKISIKEENIILKFVEEPFQNAFIIFICENKSTILPTILNRCQVFEFTPYSIDTLHQIVDFEDNSLYNICNTPGQAMYIKEHISELPAITDLCRKMIQYLPTANFANSLTISNKIAFNDEQDKINFDIFVRILHNEIKNAAISNSNYFKMYDITRKFIANLKSVNHVNKMQLFEKYLCDIKLRSFNA